MNAATVDTLKREFEKIIARKNPIMLLTEHRTVQGTEADKFWQNAYYCHPNSSQALTLQKHVRALAKHQPALYTLLLPIVTEAIAKQAEIMVAKDAALKARNAKKAAQMAKRQDAEETKKNPYRNLNKEVADLLRQVAEPYRVKAVEFETMRLNNMLAEIESHASMFGSFNPEKMFPTKQGDHWGNEIQHGKRMNAYQFLDNIGGTWALKPNMPEIVKAKAERYAEDMVTQFVYKVGTKLSGVVDKKGNLRKAHVSGSLQDHWMTFEFADKAEFQVQSQIVWKTSPKGVHFPQFPTCFRNVKLSTGAKMELPSEKKMKEQFV